MALSGKARSPCWASSTQCPPIGFCKRAALRLDPSPITSLDPLPVKERTADSEPVSARFHKIGQRFQIHTSRGKQFDVWERRFHGTNIAGAGALSRKYLDHRGPKLPGANDFRW